MTIRTLSKELQNVAETELNEVPDRIQEDLSHIREWLLTKPHLSVGKDDQWLLNNLRNSKFNFQKCKDKLEHYHKMQKETPEFFHNRDPFLPEIQEVLKRGLMVIFPQTVNPAGPKIILFRGQLADPVKAPAETIVKVLLMLQEILYIENDNFIVAGVCFIQDLSKLPYNYLTQVTPFFMKKTITCVLNAYPARLKGGYFLNSPSFFQIIFKLIRIFLPTKLKNRIKIMNDFDDIYETIPKSILPKDYGGEEISCDEIANEWKLKVESYRDWFLQNELPVVDQENIEGNQPPEKLEID